MSIQAYQRAATQAETPREIEYRAFGVATAGLVRAKEAGRARLGEFTEALDANRRLWTMLGNDCALEGNQLPAPLRANIVSLAMWVSRYTSEVIRGDSEIEYLIEVNRAMMEGLAPR